MILWKRIAEESAIWCCTSATQDVNTVLARFENEGLSFLTITLPAFGKDFERGLDQGWVDRRLFRGFRHKGAEPLPLFLGGFLDRVFDRTSGVLLDEPDIDAIRAIRQLSLMFGKVLLPTTPRRERHAMSEFVECEQEVKERDQKRITIELDDFSRMARVLFGKAFTYMDRMVRDGKVVPGHGPGSTADYLIGNEKFGHGTWTTRLQNVFPAWDHIIPNLRFIGDLEGVNLLEPGSELPVRVISVPKTLKTPRIIAIEPTVMMYMQQGLLSVVRDGLAKVDYLDSMIGLDDQTPNQRMAHQGSADGSLCTIDLSEASDRVSYQLVNSMLYQWPHLHAAVAATRSSRARVPGHGVLTLAKFASMGSALCFPMEAMVFLTIIFLGIEQELNCPVDRSFVKRMIGRVRVFGDDIIVPEDYVHSVMDSLERFGAKVNSHKSFWTGKFRESCGKEYYDGHDVSIIRVRRVFPKSRQNGQEVISLISLRNQLYFAGYWQTVKWLDHSIRKVIKYFPVVEESSPVQGRHSFLGHETQRMHAQLHSPLVKGYVINAPIPKNPLGETGALLKYFVKKGDLPSPDGDHLERSGRPQAVNIKLRWASAV